MTVYTQPTLDLEPVTWSDAFAVLGKAGVRFTRNPDSWRSSMESYSAAWWGSKYFGDGSYVHIHVQLYRRGMGFRWQIDAHRMDATGGTGFYGGALCRERHRVLLHDPTPGQAIAALRVLGVSDTSPCRWADVSRALTASGITLTTRQPRPGLTADYQRVWRGEGPGSEALAYLQARGRWVMIARSTSLAGDRPATDHQVVLYDPSPGQALAALTAAGVSHG